MRRQSSAYGATGFASIGASKDLPPLVEYEKFCEAHLASLPPKTVAAMRANKSLWFDPVTVRRIAAAARGAPRELLYQRFKRGKQMIGEILRTLPPEMK